jgi:hypothetical protein
MKTPVIVLLPLLFLAGCREATVTTPNADQLREQRFGDHGHFLREANRLEIYSIASTGPSTNPEEPPTNDEFHGFKVYGKTLTEHRPEIEAIWSEVHDRIYSEPGDSYTYCFWPRHAIRAFSDDGARDYLICFECDHLYVYPDSSSDKYERIGLEEAPGSLTLNTLLDDARVPRERPEINKSESGSGGGDGIAPITPPTPPDMRFSASGG